MNIITLFVQLLRFQLCFWLYYSQANYLNWFIIKIPLFLDNLPQDTYFGPGHFAPSHRPSHTPITHPLINVTQITKKQNLLKKSLLLLTSHMNMKCTVGKAETSFQKNPSPTKTVKKDVNKKSRRYQI